MFQALQQRAFGTVRNHSSPHQLGGNENLRTQWKAWRLGVHPSTKSLRAVAVPPKRGESSVSPCLTSTIIINHQVMAGAALLSFSQCRCGSQVWTPVCFYSTMIWLDVWQLQTMQDQRKTVWKGPINSIPSSSRQDQFSPHHSWQTSLKIEKNKETKFQGTGVEL